MKGVVKIVAVLAFVLLVGGLIAASISKVRNAAARAQCQNNLNSIGMALGNYHDAYQYFPTGTLPNPNLPPEKRLSWLVQVWPAYMMGGVGSLLDETKAWDAQENCPPRCILKRSKGDHDWYEEQLVGDVLVLMCPANRILPDPALPAPTPYLGIAGLGEAAAELPLSDRRAGFFGYDRKVSLRDIKDGTATTVAVAEAMDGGPWTAGGRATVRGLVDDDVAYLGEQGQFGALHRRPSGLFAYQVPVVTNVLFADGSVRPLTESLSPQMFEALATIAGNEEVGSFEE